MQRSMTQKSSGLHAVIGEMDKEMEESLVVLKFKATVTEETVDWLINRIKQPVSQGGAAMQVYTVQGCTEDDTVTNAFLISCTEENLLKAAERFKLVKKTSDGTLQEFLRSEADQYIPTFDSGGKSSLFSDIERNYIIQRSLNEICAEQTFSPPGHPQVKLLKDHPIVPKCVAKGMIESLFPMHCQADLKYLKKNWYMNFKEWNIPTEKVKSYFGETIALYFAFLGFYNQFLVPPCVIAIGYRIFFDDKKLEENAWFAMLNLIWATLFLEVWKRKCAELTFTWGTYKKDRDEFLLLEQPRAEYNGQVRISPITNEQEIYYPTWKRRLKMYCITYPCLFLSVVTAICGMLFYLEMQQGITARYHDQHGVFASIARRIPGIIYASIIALFNNIYSKVVKRLNDWENHRHQSSYNNHIIFKLVLFHFVNSFLSLFYIAFFLKDMELLRQHLATLLITQQIIQQVQESLVPYLTFKRQCLKISKEGKKISLKHVVDGSKVIKESKLPKYEDTYGDYLELFLQFGYVFLFSAAYPLAAFWALLNNVVEVRSDAFKLCRLFQRPFPQSASSIGAWEVAFELMSVVGVMTNCALIAMSESTRKWFGDVSIAHYILFFVAFEHILIALKIFVARVIPDTPGWVTKRLAKEEFQRRQLWKFQKCRYTNSTSSDSAQAEILRTTDSNEY